MVVKVIRRTQTNLLLIFSILLTGITYIFPQAPQTLWTKIYNGNENDYGNTVQQTSDGGFVIVGQTGSVNGQTDSGDIWLIKTNSDGDTLWTKQFDSGGRDDAVSVQQTSDNGFFIAGNKIIPGSSDEDIWIIRTDQNGDTIWSKTFGGSIGDKIYSAQLTSDGGFILAGRTFNTGTVQDSWIIRMDANGDSIWTRVLNGPGNDYIRSIKETADGGFIATGFYFSTTVGASDIWLIRTNAVGDTLWTKIYNGPYYSYSFDYGKDVIQTPDGGFLVAARINGLPNTTNSNIWLLRTDSNGDTLWTKEFGGLGIEEATSLQQTEDGDFIIAGYTYDGTTSIDAWLIKTDSNGDTLWTKVYGDSSNDQFRSVSVTSDGGYVIVGYSSSFGSGDSDVWLLRLNSENSTVVENEIDNPQNFMLFQNYPNPFNPSTKIKYVISNVETHRDASLRTTLKVYDVLGNEVATLVDEFKPAGSYEVEFIANQLPSGIYFYQLQSGESIQTKKLMLLK